MKICPKCSTEFEDKFNFCRNDGTALQAKAFGRSCPRCGKEAEEGKGFCRHCGARLDLPGEPPPTEVAKPEAREIVRQQHVQTEPLPPAVEQRVTEKIEKEVIQQEENPKQGVTQDESPTEAAERHLKEGNYTDALSTLEVVVKKDPESQEARLLHLLASIKLYNIYGYEKQIESIKTLANLSEKERGFAREIFLMRSEEALKRGQEEEAREHQRLASRVILGQSLTEPAPETKVEEPPMQRGVIKPFPEKRVEKISQSPLKEGPPAPEKVALPPRDAAPPRKKRVSGVSITLGLVLGVAGILGGGSLAYYAKKQGVSISGLFGKASTGKEQTGREIKTSGKTDVAQVLAAEELGFEVWGIGAVDVNRRESVLSEKIESQLDSLRQFYGQQIQEKPSLMGSITVQLTIGPSGQVTKVEEFSSHIKDREFKKSVIGEIYKWRFPEASSGSVEVNYPLLFLPPGMDVATLIKWEQSIGPRVTEPTETAKSASVSQERESTSPLTKPTPSKFTEARISPPPLPTPQSRSAEAKVSRHPLPSPQQPLQQPPAAQQTIAVREQYEVLYPTSLYKEPREDSERVASIQAGMRVNVVAVRGDWLEVRSQRGNPPGFIKKDSTVPVSSR